MKLSFLFLADVDGGPASEDSSMFYINKLEELPLTICRLNKKVVIDYHYLQIASIICFQI